METTRAKPLIINESALVPISLVLTVSGAVAWIASLQTTLKNIEDVNATLLDQTRMIDQRLSRIEGKLEAYSGPKK